LARHDAEFAELTEEAEKSDDASRVFAIELVPQVLFGLRQYVPDALFGMEIDDELSRDRHLLRIPNCVRTSL
jgi:hypothetical protein